MEIENVQKIESSSLVEMNDCSDLISYVTDIHLLHRYAAWKCETAEDRDWVTDMVVDQISTNDTNTRIKLIGGDVSSNFEVYSSFICKLGQKKTGSDYFFTLGNHELWPFAGEALDTIVEKYRNLLLKNGIRLVHNNLFYYDVDNSIKEITSKELSLISEYELGKKLFAAKLIIFGGVGFSGKNEQFNATHGIYRETLSREKEIAESNKFESLYLKVSRALSKKKVIIFTHMHRSNWTKNDFCVKGFIYVSGHDHRNRYYDDGKYRVYADNQIGYKQKSLSMRHLSLSLRFEDLRKYPDGIHSISRDSYIDFYRKLNEYVRLNRNYKGIYMLKREGVYMFFLVTQAGNLQVLNGGSIKYVGNHTLEYFYEHMIAYQQSIKKYLSKYDDYQNRISQEIKEIGGLGYIHGCIVDLDVDSADGIPKNHLYINPLDWSITPYYAPFSTVEKYVYKNVPSLLKYRAPRLYKTYKRKLIEKSDKSLVLFNGNFEISNSKVFVESTEMYRISKVIKALQYVLQYNVIRSWSETIALTSSEENGKQIVKNEVFPQKTKLLYRPKMLPNATLRNAKKTERGCAPDWSKREVKYKNKVAEITETIEVIKYNGIQLKSEYKCKLCGYTWQQTPDAFKADHICPNCKK